MYYLGEIFSVERRNEELIKMEIELRRIKEGSEEKSMNLVEADMLTFLFGCEGRKKK